MFIDSQHLLDGLVLAQIDGDTGNRRQDRFEDGSGARMIAREKGFVARRRCWVASAVRREGEDWRLFPAQLR